MTKLVKSKDLTGQSNSEEFDKLDEDNDKSDELLAAEALEEARKAFEGHLAKLGYDPGYWDIRFTAWVKDANFIHRLARVEIERELKDGGKDE